jgi:nitrogen fixation protein NifQ
MRRPYCRHDRGTFLRDRAPIAGGSVEMNDVNSCHIGETAAPQPGGESVMPDSPTHAGYIDLMVAAADPNDLMTLAFAGVISLANARARPYDVAIAGLDAATLNVLVRRYFPYLPATLVVAGDAPDAAARSDEFADLVVMLCEHRTVQNRESTWLAHAVATGCMDGNHLWQDMGLPDRDALSALLDVHFTTLARRNVGDMKWKKFFYRELCLRAEVPICKSPSCGACVDYPKCFGAET